MITTVSFSQTREFYESKIEELYNEYSFSLYTREPSDSLSLDSLKSRVLRTIAFDETMRIGPNYNIDSYIKRVSSVNKRLLVISIYVENSVLRYKRGNGKSMPIYIRTKKK